MIKEKVESYIALHQALGFKFRQQASLLRCFARYAAERGEDALHSQTAIEWATEAPAPASRRDRLHAVRRFAQALFLEDPHCEIPPDITFGPVGLRIPTKTATGSNGKRPPDPRIPATLGA